MKDFVTLRRSDGSLIIAVLKDGKFQKGYWVIQNTSVVEHLNEEDFLGVFNSYIKDLAFQIGSLIKSGLGNINMWVSVVGNMQRVRWGDLESELPDSHRYVIAECVMEKLLGKDLSFWSSVRELNLKVGISGTTYYVSIYFFIPFDMAGYSNYSISIVKDVDGMYSPKIGGWEEVDLHNDSIGDRAEANKHESEMKKIYRVEEV